MKKTYRIELMGCDDTTIFEMELTQDEFDFVKQIAEKSEEVSTYGCMPTLGIEEVLLQAIDPTEPPSAAAAGKDGTK